MQHPGASALAYGLCAELSETISRPWTVVLQPVPWTLGHL